MLKTPILFFIFCKILTPEPGVLLSAIPPAPRLPVPRAPGEGPGQRLPPPPHGVLGQHHGPEGDP